MPLNALNWFEIPADDLERARTFYTTIYGKPLDVWNFGSGDEATEMIMLPADEQGVGGAICKIPGFVPGSSGARVYLNANPSLQAMLDRVVAAGGSVVQERTKISDDIGYMAMFTDSEGNLIALHGKE